MSSREISKVPVMLTFLSHNSDVMYRAKRETAREVGGRFVMSHMWDAEDPRLLVCEAKSLHSTKKQKDSYLSSSPKEDKASAGLECSFILFTVGSCY